MFGGAIVANEMLEKILEAENQAKVKLSEAEETAKAIVDDAMKEAEKIKNDAKNTAEEKGRKIISDSETNFSQSVEQKLSEASSDCDKLSASAEKKADACFEVVLKNIIA